jgi:pimeloyl-ACP methyl ester carboxylesterase
MAMQPVRIEPFRIHVADEVLDDLRERIRRTRWPDLPPAPGFEYGFEIEELRQILAAWGRFDWRARERELNRFGQFLADVDGFSIHFVRVPGRGPAPLPLVITHGWPSSFAEMLHLAEMLADPAAHGGDAADAFEVIIPSLPGYAFSTAAKEPGIVKWHIAGLWHRLMTEGLGFAKFGAHGVDIGSGVTSRLGLRFPGSLAGIHLSAATFLLPVGIDRAALDREELAFLAGLEDWLDKEGAYDHIQGTRPQTLSYGVNDSPAGMAAWIVEKFRTWSDCGGDVRRTFSDATLLTNLTLYWATSTFNSSIRLYFEDRNHGRPFLATDRVEVPTAVAIFPNEYFKESHPPRKFVERTFNVVRWNSFPRGGHFPALEQPEVLARDIREFFGPLR